MKDEYVTSLEAELDETLSFLRAKTVYIESRPSVRLKIVAEGPDGADRREGRAARRATIGATRDTGSAGHRRTIRAGASAPTGCRTRLRWRDRTTETTPMNILVVAEDFPWPSTGGGMIRLGKIIEACLPWARRTSSPSTIPAGTLRRSSPTVSIERMERCPIRSPLARLKWRTAWLARRGVPIEVVMRAGDPVASSPLRILGSRQLRRRVVQYAPPPSPGWDVLGSARPSSIWWTSRTRRLVSGRSSCARQSPGCRVHLLAPPAVAAAQAAKNAATGGPSSDRVAGQVDKVVLSSDVDRSPIADFPMRW